MTTRRNKPARRSGIQPTIGLIVEGDAEYLAFPLLHKRSLITNCPPLKATNLGGVGSDVAPVGIAKLIAPKVLEHVAAGRTKVVVCMDREQRTQCAPGLASAIASALAAEIESRGKAPADVHIVIADRTFEAWLLADARGLHRQGKFKHAPGFHSFEGQPGQNGKKGVVELNHLLGRTYSKTSDGPKLFASLSFPDARAHQKSGHGSRSLDKFLRTLGL